MLVSRGPLTDPEFKGQFSGHETFPLRNTWLKKVVDSLIPGSVVPREHVFDPHYGISHFGVGKNMVAAIRHWGNVLGVIEFDTDRLPVLTDFGRVLFADDGYDPFLENLATVWLLHWRLSSNHHQATTFFWAFNHFGGGVIDREVVLRDITVLSESLNHKRATKATLKRDVDCFFRTYAGASERTIKTFEDSLDSPFSELGLLEPSGFAGQYELRRGKHVQLPNWVLVIAISEFWQRFPQSETMSGDFLSYEPGSPGQVFKFDETSFLERLSRIEDASLGVFRWSETAGMNQLMRVKETISAEDVIRHQMAQRHDRSAA